MQCSKCNSLSIVKFGIKIGKKIRKKQQYQCKNCGSLSYGPYVEETDKDIKSIKLRNRMMTQKKLMNLAVRAAYAASKK